MMDYRKLLRFPQKCAHSLINHPLGLFLLAGSLPFFGTVTAFAVMPGDKAASVPDVVVQTVTQRLALPEFRPAASNARYWRAEIIQRGDTLFRVLNRLGVRDSDARRFLASGPVSKDLLRLKTGASISVQTNDDGDLFGLSFLNDDENGEKVLVALTLDKGQWQASADPVETDTIDTLRTVGIRGSMSSSFARAGIPREVTAQLDDVFADRLDLDKLVNGDSVRLVYETLLYNGSPIATGRILAAEVTHDGHIRQAFYVAHDSESGAYYDEQGQPVRKGFSRQPVSNYRISSGFGTRYHPILRSLRMHEGVDYAAAAGTPIVAPADGVVKSAGWQGGYGKAVEIRHSGKLATLYGHMQGFAAGLKAGQVVKAGDVIGYVGSTGRSTGAHLHFEVKVNGQPVDPATAALPAQGLTTAQLTQFTKDRQIMSSKLALLDGVPLVLAQKD